MAYYVPPHRRRETKSLPGEEFDDYEKRTRCTRKTSEFDIVSDEVREKCNKEWSVASSMYDISRTLSASEESGEYTIVSKSSLIPTFN